MNNMSLIVLMVVMLGMVFFSQNKQKKQMQQRQDELKNLKKGDRVVTIGGLHADVDSVDADNNLIVLDAEGIYLTFDLQSIRTIAKAEQAPSEPIITEDTAVQD